MRNLYNIKRNVKDNEKFLNMISYHLAKRDYSTTIKMIKNVSQFTKCNELRERVKGLFITQNINKEYFGMAENIVGSMTNVVFSGNVKITVEDEQAQKLIDELYFDGYLLDNIKEAYKTAISMAHKAESFLFFNTIQEYDNRTEVKIKDEFINFEVVPSFEVEEEGNILTRRFYKTFSVGNEDETRTYEYRYTTTRNMKTDLLIVGYNEDDERLSDEQVKEDLKIDNLQEHFDFVPYIKFEFGQGMLPNILWIENSLAENLYFQDEDLSNSQTITYIPESSMYEYEALEYKGERGAYYDKYQTKKVLKGDNLEAQELVSHVKGHSVIDNIEKNLALNVIQASLDAKISPITTGYSLVDKIASNTDVGRDKERVTIRLRENHITSLKVFTAKTVQLFLYLNNYIVDESDVSVLIDPYIVPSFEGMVNTLSKAVQFGIMSRYEAVRRLNKDELSQQELEEEYERIKEMTTQIDYNVDQQKQMEKGNSNVLGKEVGKEKDNEKD